MATPSRLTAALSVVAAALLFAGCASTPGADTPTSSPAPTASDDAGDMGDAGDMEGAILDGGRMFAVVTRGSSTCVPHVGDVSADGQTVIVTLSDADLAGESGGETLKACTDDFAARASIGALPEGVDPTADITLQVTYGDLTREVELSGDAAFAAAPGSPTEYQPSAGWFDDGGIVLLTWGSSGCPPVVESVQGSGASGTATFVTAEDQICTMDMAPRATVLVFAEDEVEEDGFTLTLSGGGLDGTVPVMGG